MRFDTWHLTTGPLFIIQNTHTLTLLSHDFIRVVTTAATLNSCCHDNHNLLFTGYLAWSVHQYSQPVSSYCAHQVGSLVLLIGFCYLDRFRFLCNLGWCRVIDALVNICPFVVFLILLIFQPTTTCLPTKFFDWLYFKINFIISFQARSSTSNTNQAIVVSKNRLVR